MVDLTVAVCNGETETTSADASLLLEQLQQQLEEQLVREKATAELQHAEGAAAKEVEIHSFISEVVANVTHEVLAESAARCASYEEATTTITAPNKVERAEGADEEDPYTSPEEEYEDSEEEEEQERYAEGVADYYGQLLSVDNTCVSPGQNNAPTLAPTPPAGGKTQQQDTPGHGPGYLQSPPVSAPRAPAIGRIEDLQQKQLGVIGSSAGVLA
jgi:hypothetical protein